MQLPNALLSGLAGAVALTTFNESARRIVPQAPRMDLLGEQAFAKLLSNLGETPPTGDRLYAASLAGDLISNAVYYSAVGAGDPKNAVRNGLMLGLAAGAGAVGLPGPLGLSESTTSRSTTTSLLTVGWYVVGGLVAGLTYRLLANRAARKRTTPNGGTKILPKTPDALAS
jgi:hypothetical protein